MATTILYQTVIMLILMLVGVICSKTRLISNETNKELSKFVLQVVNPVVIFVSYQTDYSSSLVKNLLLTFALSLGTMVAVIIAAGLLIRGKDRKDSEIERFSAIYSNCGFMGIPLVNALFGTEGVFYLTAYITVFNILVWTHGIILISGEKSLKQVVRVICSPTIIAIALGLITFFVQIKLPSPILGALEFIKDLNTPLAMVVSGMTIAGTNITGLLKKFRIYYVCLLKLIVIPLLIAAAMAFFGGIDEKVRMTVLVAASAPPAAMCTLQCIRYGKNSVYASELFAAGTILSVLSLPLVVRSAEYLTKIL